MAQPFALADPAMVAGGLTVAALVSWGMARRSGMVGPRRRSRLRGIVVVGIDDDSVRLLEVLAARPELGYTVTGIIGPRNDALRCGLDDLWLGGLAHAEALIAFVGVSAAVVSASVIPTARLAELVGNLRSSGIHLHVAAQLTAVGERSL